MPINPKKMATMKKQYGNKKGEDVYYATENIAKMSHGKNKKKSKAKKKKRG